LDDGCGVSVPGCDEAHSLDDREGDLGFLRHGVRVEVYVDGEREVSICCEGCSCVELSGCQDECLLVGRIHVGLVVVSRRSE
jgi:hypothetical protein